MDHPPLQRHEAMKPFSRDHYQGLVQAQRLLKSADGEARDRRAAVDGFLRAWDAEIAEHFADEERLLPQFMTEEHRDRLLTEHVELRQLADMVRQNRDQPDPGKGRVGRLGQRLHDHIRWEERELFPAIEAAAGTEALEDLQRHTLEFESRRPRSHCATGRDDATPA